jgi:uncharacterized membrane protein YhaH (DUF805 family)
MATLKDHAGVAHWSAPHRLVVVSCWLLFGAGVAFILLRAVIAPRPEVDFRFFWLAGYLWGQGIDPYSADYQALSSTVLPEGNRTPAWVYPPHWWAICRAFALVSIDQAVVIWRLLYGAMLIGGTWMLATSLFADRGRAASLIAAASAGVVCLLEPTAIALSLGQSAAFAYLGLCLLVAGFVRRSRTIDVVAILLLSLKPQLGLPIILALLLLRRYWMPIALATVAGVVLALPQFVAFGPIATFEQLLGSLAGYSGAGLSAAENPNAPVAGTGIMNLVGHVYAGASTAPGFALAIMLALFAGIAIRRFPDKQLPAMLLLVCVVISITPLHSYDLGLLVVPVLMFFSLDRSFGYAALPAIFLALRPGKLEAMLGVPLYGNGVSAGAIGLSIAALWLLLLAVWVFLSGARVRPDVSRT